MHQPQKQSSTTSPPAIKSTKPVAVNKLISIDLYADFGCLKKPDTNDPVYLTFNMLHKPALLGILGAIVGLEGFSEPQPPKPKKKKSKDLYVELEPKRIVAPYYEVLKDLKIGIRPLELIDGKINPNFNGNFSKTILTYNNGVGYANIQGGVPGNLMVTEQMLIAPVYRCFILFEKECEVFTQLFENLKNQDAEYLPYLGKNEFSVWWTNWQEYNWRDFNPNDQSFEINSVFIKEEPVKEGKTRQRYKVAVLPSFMYFENLPVGYDKKLMQYEYDAFAYTNSQLKQEYPVGQLYQLTDVNEVVQLF